MRFDIHPLIASKMHNTQENPPTRALSFQTHLPLYRPFPRPSLHSTTPPLSRPRCMRNRRLIFACDDHAPITPSPPPAPLTRRESMPTILRGPEAVLGIVLAAAALLADFARNIARLMARPGQAELSGDLQASIEVLSDVLDKSKAVLVDTEGKLDESLARASSAETALQGLGDTRATMREAKEKTIQVERQLKRIAEAMREGDEKWKEMEGRRERGKEEIEKLERLIREKEAEMEELLGRFDKVAGEDVAAKGREEQRERELREEVERREEEVERVRLERMEVETNANELEEQTAEVTEQAEAAELALRETQKELERVQKEVDAWEKERLEVEMAREERLVKQEEMREMQSMMGDMEREVENLRRELEDRDEMVRSVSAESEELKQLMEIRNGELKDLTLRMEDVYLNGGNGGDAELSKFNLEDVKRNMEAEQLTLKAEISKAELAANKGGGVLDRLVKEMDAEEMLMEAGLRKMEAAVRREEAGVERKNDAVDQVLESIEEAVRGGDELPVEEVLQRLSDAARQDGEGETVDVIQGMDVMEQTFMDGVQAADLDGIEVGEAALDKVLREVEKEEKKKRRRRKKTESETVGVAKQGVESVAKKRGRKKVISAEEIVEGSVKSDGKVKKKRGRPRKKGIKEETP